MQLSPWSEEERVLGSDLHSSVVARAPFTTPWRALIVGGRPGDLVERNHLILNLNPPCAIEDTSWIVPGRVIRDVTVSTDGGMACADFMADRGMEYIEFDAGWYGPEASVTSDARSVDVSHRSPGDGAAEPPELDLQRVIEYARGMGIGVWLYVNHQALERQMDELFPLYESWGVVGIKAGFVRVGPQDWSRWICDMVRKAADHHLMVDIHDDYRPTGFSRTYPNLLTQEGIRGNEHMPTPGHNCTLPFTRYPAGAGDYTPCYYSDRIVPTHAHQLALPVVFYSPAMFLFWYDRPSAYGGEPEIAFWERLPTVWDDTRVLDAVIGEYVTVARRSGNVWFVGSLTNEDARVLEIPLQFLSEGVTYDAEIYSDSPPVDTGRTHVLSERCTMDAGVAVRAELAPGGGHAMRLSPRGNS
jgi:alpha-glucosidase